MKRIALGLVLVGAVAVACAVPAQQEKTHPILTPKRTLQQKDSVFFKPSPELQKSMDELAASIQALALRLANDPQLRAAAFQVASGLVTTAQQVINEQSGVIQEALKTAAQRISEIQAAQQRVRKP